MKKILLSFLCIALSLTVFANSKEHVIMEQVIQNSTTRPRSLVQKPTVFIDYETLQLSIKFTTPTESFTLFVYDEKGTVVYQGNVITDGGEFVYQLPKLESGFYTISIESDNRTFEGEISI